MSMRFLHYDVFTDRPFEGNQLAVFPDGRGLDASLMQRIAREMAFSETTFILPAETAGTDVRMRIFTPLDELPMAGHPTVGSTFALAHLGVIPPGAARFTFGLGVGPTPVALEWDGDRLSFAWMTQPLPQFGRVERRVEPFALALGVAAEDIHNTNLPVQEVSCGVPCLFVPLVSREAVDSAMPDRRALAQAYNDVGVPSLPVFVFSPGPPGGEITAYSRMFAPDFGIEEDPATGGASGPLGCYLVKHGVVPVDRAGSMLSLQGVKMGRPSRIHIAIDVGPGGDIVGVRVGGRAVLVAEGRLMVDRSVDGR